jgi:hypothetical protein
VSAREAAVMDPRQHRPTTEHDLLRGYAPQTWDAAADHALRIVIEERIRVLWHARQHWRRGAYSALWSEERRAAAAELRALVRLARAARRLTEAAPDPITLAKAVTDRVPGGSGRWTEAELREAWGG